MNIINFYNYVLCTILRCETVHANYRVFVLPRTLYELAIRCGEQMNLKEAAMPGT